MSRNRLTWDQLPLYASDDEIGEAALGPTRKVEFAGLAASQERMGMPTIDPVWGGRYVPAVKAFWDHEYKIGGSTAVPLAPNGVEGKFHGPRRKAGNARPETTQAKDRPTGPVLVR